ncbi:uncharacterized protein A4U43_C07F30400 [Asparagus officinalis]|uniref:TCP domain-containing protein n=1 Tax=Asparagus officinalis TaxID=4686 RepID=A0A5P1EJ63_ASPOF|nr:transcription factor TCP13-like [Asparagus officinalis]XP_020275826.1 transcription factor TCP13-like [Asparagus officinalis]XP_020275828.1 transcription factor TCP13-like [Asparagus officinalis]XP_020275829.1 transcription factor TCP13-like [Asparagus officinalis]ONK64829.1 uncharacterized protein A4U43_C07F30400 [Asparagus officinalis]
MINNRRDRDLQAKEEGDQKIPPTSSSRLWSGLKNPRIVRVSRAFGGKDRHSKVSTIRGLRDRRVRLSVPTAIQLYDLQDRLGLNQPSKVVDWLINAAQHEIDKLPPLQIPPEGFIQLPPQVNRESLVRSFSQSTQRDEPKEILREKENTTKGNDMANAQVLPSHFSLLGSLSNTMPYTSYYNLEAANAYLSQIGVRSSHSNEAQAMSIPSSRNLPLESQIVFCPPGIMPSMFQSNVTNPMEFNAKQFGQLQMVNSVSQTPQSNLEINSLHLSSPQERPSSEF